MRAREVGPNESIMARKRWIKSFATLGAEPDPLDLFAMQLEQGVRTG
jgi:hypothetical protein